MGFTLVELLIVISIIAVLAALIFPAGAAIKRLSTRKKVESERALIETAIESYHAKLGHYPPDNPVAVSTSQSNALNQLYFELMGTEPDPNDPNYIRTLDASTRIKISDFSAIFGANNVAGFVNFTRDRSGDGAVAKNCFSGTGLKSSQYDDAGLGLGERLLVCSEKWPADLGKIIDGKAGTNPWRYRSTNPAHNQNSYDLWVDVLIGGKTNRISNWSDSPQTVYGPYP